MSLSRKKDLQESTSWENSKPWYNSCVGEKGHFYHQSIILPSSLKMLGISEKSSGSLLDIGCGQGVLARHLPSTIDYTGLDLSPSLIREAKKQTNKKDSPRIFLQADATLPFALQKKDFDWAVFMLSLQNMQTPEKALAHAGEHLKKGGKLLLVLNHPCFRIPRQSDWGVDPKTHLQYRRMNVYMSPLKIPIQTHPGKGEKSSLTYSFHYPLSQYIQWLTKEIFYLDGLEEWCSSKESEGAKARMENRARKEFPLFLALRAVKR